ncbi:MAG: DUF4386 domain-containing protein [Acidobacteriota bacterium]
MTISTIDESQQKVAKVVGVVYLFAMVTAALAEYFIRRFIMPGNAAETARSVMAHERLFHFSIASELITLASTVALLAALYVILGPVNRRPAFRAKAFRVVVTAFCVGMSLTGLDGLRLLSGAGYVGAQGAGDHVAFVFLGLGSTLFTSLWLNYIPRALAAMGVLASLLLATGSFAFIIVPKLAKIVSRRS